MSERLKYIDSLRGFAIFLVVLGHSMAWTYPNWQIALDSGNISTMLWWRIIYSFHMPLFFFVSALLYKPGVPFSTLKKRFVNLLIPFFSVGFVGTALHGSFTIDEFPWFLRTLFEFTLIEISYDFISNKCGYLKKRFIIHIAYMMFIFYAVNHIRINGFDVIWDVDHFSLFNYSGYCLGILLREKPKLEVLLNEKYVNSLLSILFIVVMYFYLHEFNIPYVLIILPVIAIMLIYNFFKNYDSSGKILGYFNSIGRYSLQIYLIHGFFKIRIVEIGDYFYRLSCSSDFSLVLSSVSLQLLYGSLIAVIMIKMSLFLSFLISRYGLLNLCFFGKSM